MTDPSRRSRLHAAAVEGRVALGKLDDLLGQSRQQLDAERAQLAAAERRARQAAAIDDAETLRVAEEFTAKHRERVAVLERKVEAQEAEIALLRRDVDAVVRELKGVGAEVDPVPDPGPDIDDARLSAELDRAQRESQADQLLEALKRKMGK